MHLYTLRFPFFLFRLCSVVLLVDRLLQCCHYIQNVRITHTHTHTGARYTVKWFCRSGTAHFSCSFRHHCDKVLMNQILLHLFQQDPFCVFPPPPNRLDPDWACSRRLYSTLCPFTVQCRLLCKTLKAVDISCIPRFTHWVSRGSTFGAATVSGFFHWRIQCGLVRPSRTVKQTLLCQNCSMILFLIINFFIVFYHFVVVMVVLKTMLNLRPLHTENACNKSETFSKILTIRLTCFYVLI